MNAALVHGNRIFSGGTTDTGAPIFRRCSSTPGVRRHTRTSSPRCTSIPTSGNAARRRRKSSRQENGRKLSYRDSPVPASWRTAPLLRIAGALTANCPRIPRKDRGSRPGGHGKPPASGHKPLHRPEILLRHTIHSIGPEGTVKVRHQHQAVKFPHFPSSLPRFRPYLKAAGGYAILLQHSTPVFGIPSSPEVIIL